MNKPDQTTAPKTDAWPPEGAGKSQPQKPSTGADSPAPPASQEVAGLESPPLAATASVDLLPEILTSVYRAEGMAAQGFAALRERLDAIEKLLGGSAQERGEDESGAAPEGDDAPSPARSVEDESPSGQVVAEVVPEQAKQVEPTEDEATTDRAPTAAPVARPVGAAEQLPPTAQPVAQAPQAAAQQMPQPAHPVRDVRPVAAQPRSGELEAIVFGQDLAYHESLPPQRQALLADVRRADENAIGLVGQVLCVRAATMDRLPTLLKDVGEAWFRWRPDQHGAPDPLRDALIAWLHSRLEAVGLGNRIELVRVGDRYDSKRHNAKTRGVEVTGVHGWVVLRDNGNVYTKATVTVA